MSDAGVVGVTKHMPGQGRATLDTHYDLPAIGADAATLEQDLSIFAALADQMVMGMTCHVIFEAFDPHLPTTLSETVISEVIRKRIGFDGLLMTDDLGMDALGGAPGVYSARYAGKQGDDDLIHTTAENRQQHEKDSMRQIPLDPVAPEHTGAPFRGNKSGRTGVPVGTCDLNSIVTH